MRFLIIAAVISAAVASVIHQPIIAAQLLEGDSNSDVINNSTTAPGAYEASSIIFYEHKDFWGMSARWFWESESSNRPGDDPDKAICYYLHSYSSGASSIQFKQTGKRISCTFYDDAICKGKYMWLGKDQRDLATMGWDNKVKAAKCWFFDARKRRTTPGTDLAKRDGVKDLVPVPPEANPELAKWVITVHEHPNYQGTAWGYSEEWIKTRECATAPPDAKVSSIRFYADRNHIMCTGYKNTNCQGSDQPNTELGIVSDFPNLAQYRFDDVLQSFLCWRKR